MSRSAAALIRAISAQLVVTGHRILLTEARSIDWHSLTFAGERHEIALAVVGPRASGAANELVASIGDIEFSLAGYVVADIAAKRVGEEGNASISVAIEALTISA